MRPIHCCCLLAVAALGCQSGVRLNGGGSSFVYPLMLKWSREYADSTGVQVDYQSTGSGNGIQQMTVETVNFGCTDTPLNDEQLQKARDLHGNVLQIPLVMGGVVPVYHVPELPHSTRLRFTGDILAAIFLGRIDRWNDERIVAINPGVKLPDQRILVVSRSDPSGTTAIFADYVSKVAPNLWQELSMGPAGMAVRWPAGEAQKGNEGVAGLVRRVPGSMGYVELKYALDVGLSFGEVKNRAGKFVVASPLSVQAAAANALQVIPGNLCFSIVNSEGDESYPISGAVWAAFYRDQPGPIHQHLARFFRWALDPAFGQKYALDLGYAPLPDKLRTAVLNALPPETP